MSATNIAALHAAASKGLEYVTSSYATRSIPDTVGDCGADGLFALCVDISTPEPQRGTNENTKGQLRQYFPKKTDLAGYSQADLNKLALRLSQRPRKLWAFKLRQINFKRVLHRLFEPAHLVSKFTRPADSAG